MRYEITRGDKRSWYELWRAGRQVHLQWGLLGKRGSAQMIPLETEADAILELERRCKDLAKRGYKLVDEDAVPDPSTSAHAKLTMQLPLGESPRYLFLKGKHFGWVEARGDLVITVEGLRDQAESLKPIEQRHVSAAIAIRARDAAIAKYLTRGYELETFEVTAAPPPPYKKPRRSKPELADVAALEELVIENPDDENTWGVLEDKLLEVEDPRGRLLLLQRESRRDEELAMREEFLPLLLGSKHIALDQAIREGASWRGGYLVMCSFNAEPLSLVDRLLAAPATRLLRCLELESSSPQRARELAMHVVQAHPRALRELLFDNHWYRDTPAETLDAALLAPLRLRTLVTDSALFLIRNLAAIPTLRRFEGIEGTLADLRELFVGTLPDLEELRLEILDTETTSRRRWIAELRETFERLHTFAPSLRRLTIAPTGETVAVLRELLPAVQISL